MTRYLIGRGEKIGGIGVIGGRVEFLHVYVPMGTEARKVLALYVPMGTEAHRYRVKNVYVMGTEAHR